MTLTYSSTNLPVTAQEQGGSPLAAKAERIAGRVEYAQRILDELGAMGRPSVDQKAAGEGLTLILNDLEDATELLAQRLAHLSQHIGRL